MDFPTTVLRARYAAATIHPGLPGALPGHAAGV